MARPGSGSGAPDGGIGTEIEVGIGTGVGWPPHRHFDGRRGVEKSPGRMGLVAGGA